MDALLALLFGVAWYTLSEPFSGLLAQFAPPAYGRQLYANGPLILGGLMICALMVVNGLHGSMTNQRTAGMWQSGPGRRVIGFAAHWATFSVLSACIAIALQAVIGGSVVPLGIALVLASKALRPFKIVLGRVTRPLRWFLAGRHVGLGGTASFSGILDEWANPWRPGQVLLGASLYDPKWIVGVSDDRHVCTIATSRAGKGRSVIIPNLLAWPGSALVIDPKGQNALVTAEARGKGGPDLAQCLGQTVRILDPLGEINDPALQVFKAQFNPLADLDPRASDYVERVELIADALVVPDTKAKDNFFDTSSRILLSGLVDYVVRDDPIPRADKHLGTVRDLLIHPDGPPLESDPKADPPFRGMDEMGGLAQAAASLVLRAGQNAAGDVIATAISHTKWLDSIGMRQVLAASDFRLEDLNEGGTTVYLVLPPSYLEIHARFLRLFVNLALNAATTGRKGKHVTLFLLDEFYALGRLQQLAKAAGLLAGFGIKLWPIIQNLGQVQELYPQNWETFMGNAGIWQAFAMNDQTTARYLSERLGKRALWRKMRGPEGYEFELAGNAHLRDAQELSKATSRESGNMAVFTETGDVFLLRRTPYDRLFPRNRYRPDPFENGASR
jgi:type IV secretory pathway TraG/TraD family ATPase VirD4